MDSFNLIECSMDVNEKTVYTSVQKELNMNILHSKEENEMTKLFQINTQVKNTTVDALFDFDSLEKLTAKNQVNKLVLDVHDYLNHYPLEWVNRDVELKVTK